MKYAVLGAGGVGGLVGGALARAGHPVTLILLPESAKRHPRYLSLRSQVLGEFKVPVAITTQLVLDADVMWIAVKATQLDDAVSRLRMEQFAPGLVIPLLNGIDHVAKLRATYPRENVMPGSIRVESERTAPGEISQLSPFAAIQLAAAGPAAARGVQVAEEISAAGLTCEVVEDEASMLWGKMAFLAPLALTTAAKSAPLGAIRSDRSWWRRLESCLTEVCHAGHAQGARIDSAEALARLTAAPENMRSSMQKDLEAGRTPELDAIGGPVVRAGRAHGFDVSTTEDLMTIIAARAAQG
jgi:2-dehydropantoate 2-reductase